MFWMSYTQSNNLKPDACLYRWKLRRIDNINLFKPNIYTLFGSAVHKTCQDWIRVIYNKTKREAMQMDLVDIFKKKLMTIYKKEKSQYQEDFVTMNEIKEAVLDARKIFPDFKKKWFEYFGVRGWKLEGIEKIISVNLRDGVSNLKFFGKVDVVIYSCQDDKYYIIDLKTSFNGWNKEQARKKRDQLLYYKKFYAKQYKIPLNKIVPMFIILRRKVFGEKDMDFKVSRVSKKVPPSKRALKSSIKTLNENIDRVFEEKNNQIVVKKDIDFKVNPSPENCKWCPYKDTKYCDKGV